MKKLIAIIFLSGSITVVAQQPTTELKTLINQSFGYYPRFKELDQAVHINEQRMELAATATQPVINGSAAYNYVAPVARVPFPDANGNVKEFQMQPNHNFNSSINILEPLYDFGKTKLSIERARLDVQQSKNTIEYNKAQLAAQVATIYYTIAYLQKAIAIQNSAINVLQANRQLMEDKYKNGDALKLDVLTIQNNIDIEENRKADLQNNLQKQYNLLQYATGQTVAPAVSSFNFGMLAGDSSTALQSAQASNYDYIMAQQRIKQSEADVALSKLNTKPSINLNGSTGFRNGFVPNIGQVRFNYAVGVGVNIPIYSGGRNKKQTAIAESLVKQNQLALESLDNQYRKDIQQALEDLHTNEARLRTSEDQVSIAKEALRVTQSRYKNGITTNVELLNANNNLQRVELAQLQYQYQATLAQIELARLMGVKYW